MQPWHMSGSWDDHGCCGRVSGDGKLFAFPIDVIASESYQYGKARGLHFF